MAIYFSKIQGKSKKTQGLIADLHIHSTASDGEYRPAQIAKLLEKRGIRVAALADHDSIAGFDEFRSAFNGCSVPGIELSVQYGEHSFHLLAYGFDPENRELKDQLLEFQKLRHERILKTFERLNELGIPLAIPEEYRHFNENLTLGRPHIARALLAAGHIRDFNEAFTRYVGEGKIAYLPKIRMKFEDTMGLIRRAGGISILAHPGQYQPALPFETLVSIPVHGLEIYHPHHSLSYTRVLRDHCLRNNIPYSGGSDFHDLRKNKSNVLGAYGLNTEEWENLLAFMKANCAYPFPKSC